MKTVEIPEKEIEKAAHVGVLIKSKLEAGGIKTATGVEAYYDRERGVYIYKKKRGGGG